MSQRDCPTHLIQPTAPTPAQARRRRGGRGFTLVEILIVVIIIGILAAIVIPQFSNASEDARTNSASTLRQTVRSQLQLYRIEHNGNYPTADGAPTSAWDWAKLVQRTDDGGNVLADGKYGPYLQSEPVNPFNSKSAVAATAGDGIGFTFDENGKFDVTDKTMNKSFDAQE